MAFTVQFPPQLTASPLIEHMAASHFDAVLAMDAPGGAIGLSSLATAALLKRAGVETIIHLGGRDRNRLALQSDIISQGALGIPNLLIDIRPVSRASFSQNADARLVTDLQGPALLATAVMLRDEAHFISGASIKTPPALYIGIYSDLALLETHMQGGALNKAQYVVTTPVSNSRDFAEALATFQNAYPDFLRTRPLLVSLPLPVSPSETNQAATEVYETGVGAQFIAPTSQAKRLHQGAMNCAPTPVSYTSATPITREAGIQQLITTIEALKGLDSIRGFNIVASEQADLALLEPVVRGAGDR